MYRNSAPCVYEKDAWTTFVPCVEGEKPEWDMHFLYFVSMNGQK